MIQLFCLFWSYFTVLKVGDWNFMENSKKNREIDYNFEIVNVRTIFVKSAHLTRLLEGKNLQLHFVALKSYLKL